MKWCYLGSKCMVTVQFFTYEYLHVRLWRLIRSKKKNVEFPGFFFFLAFPATSRIQVTCTVQQEEGTQLSPGKDGLEDLLSFLD